MNITFSENVPDSTYFCRGDAEPIVRGNTIVLRSGQGTRRRTWGAPGVTSTIVVHEDDFAAVHVGYYHKHGGDQFWRFYVEVGGQVKKVSWNDLSEEQQRKVLESMHHAPTWAIPPGKLKSARKPPQLKEFVAYKILRRDEDGTLRSLYDGSEWQMGKRRGQRVGKYAGEFWEDVVHDGGFYVYPDLDGLLKLWEEGKLVGKVPPGKYVVVECMCSGRVARFPRGKLAVTYCKPVRILMEIEK